MPAGESITVHLGAGLVGLVLGIMVGPLADRISTNAPAHERLLGPTPRSTALPFVVGGTAILGAGCGLVFGLSFEALISAFFCWILVIVTRTDLEHRLIPNRVVLPAAGIVLVARTIDDPSIAWIVGAAGAGLVMFVIVLVYPSGMGMGDVKLSAFLGAGLGAAVVSALFIGLFAAFVPAAFVLIRRGKSALKGTLPLGPFLALGGVIALFAGDAIVGWYTQLGG